MIHWARVISIVIPTFNEAELLPETLARIQCNTSEHEIVVSDAVSTDRTLEIAEAARCRVIRGVEPHRAKQMNHGAKHAHGEVLFFLHADTLIAPNALHKIQVALTNRRIVGGGFRRRYLNAPVFLNLTCAVADWRGRCLGWFLGDQGIFVRRSAFEQIGGFQEIRVFEDMDFCRRLKHVGKLVCIGPPVLSSARRFAKRGAFLTTLRDGWLTCRYLAGLGPLGSVTSQKSEKTT